MVKPKELQDWLQVIGLFGVVASLIFVGLEMRQAQQIARSQANQARTDTTVSLLVELAANPYMVGASAKLANGEPLTVEEQGTYRIANVAILFNYENTYLQYLDGFIPEQRWTGTRANLKAALGSDADYGTRHVFEARPDGWSDAFSDVVIELLAEIDAERAARDRE